MKKLISVALALFLALALVSCGKSGTSSLETGSANSDKGFVKPEQYASVLLITINPQFRLYLDESGSVLAVEAVNKDAESIKDEVDLKNKSLETVIEAIVTAANKNGFIKEDAAISFEIVESKETDTAKADILTKAEKTANNTANELKIEIKVNISDNKTEAEQSSPPTESSNNQASSKPADVQSPSSSASNSSQTSSKSEPAHTHSFSAATCTEPKKCSCGAVEGTALGHDYKDGVCTRCNAKDPNYKPTSVLQKQGEWTLKFLNGKQLYSVSITLCEPGKNYADVGFGDPLDSPPDDPDMKNSCEVFNGKYYYFGIGDGDDIKDITEENGTVTLTDTSVNKLVLTRTGENSLQCASAPKTFARIEGIPAGSVFTFTAK